MSTNAFNRIAREEAEAEWLRDHVRMEAEDVRREIRVRGAAFQLLDALRGITERYTQLANSGDCGNWDVEAEPCVQAAYAAINAAEGRK